MHAHNWLEAFSSCRVLVVGDLMLDEYCGGHIERISPEAPVPILNLVSRESTLGGAGNVVKNLRGLNVQVTVVGVLGEDETAEEVLELLGAQGVDGNGIVRDAQRRSTRKVRFVSLEHGQQVFRVDEESAHAVLGKTEREISTLVREKAASAQVILCSDYLKGVLTEAVLKAAFAAGRERGIPVIVSPKDTNPQKYEGASILMPNVKELSRLVGTPADGNGWLMESARELTRWLGLEALLVTRGSEGMSLFEATDPQVNGSGLRRVDIPTVARNVYDVTGAGDTAIGAFAAALAAGADRESAAQLANVAAGIVVGKHGTATAKIEEIQDHLIEQELQARRTAGISPVVRTG